jgi:hypothetical protein
LIQRYAADDQPPRFAIDIRELRFGGNEVFQAIFHVVSPLR